MMNLVLVNFHEFGFSTGFFFFFKDHSNRVTEDIENDVIIETLTTSELPRTVGLGALGEHFRAS